MTIFLTWDILETIEYNYENDRLASYNGQACGNYDGVGNPKLYKGKELSWNHVRNLQSFDDITYSYNESNLRIKKSAANIQTQYYWNNSQLLAEKRSLSTSEIQVGENLTPGYIYATDIPVAAVVVFGRWLIKKIFG